MIQEKDTLKGLRQMVWGAIWLTPNGRVGRSPLIIIERDPDAAKNGYSASSYIETLTHGLLY